VRVHSKKIKNIRAYGDRNDYQKRVVFVDQKGSVYHDAHYEKIEGLCWNYEIEPENRIVAVYGTTAFGHL
jgi:hypothetical protein